MLTLIIFLGLILTGCHNQIPVIGLTHHQHSLPEIKQNGKDIHIIAESFEALQSKYIPVINSKGKLETSHQHHWLRRPARLIEEQLQNMWTSTGGKLSNKSKNALIILKHAHIKKDNFFIEIDVKMGEQLLNVYEEGKIDEIETITLKALSKIIVFLHST